MNAALFVASNVYLLRKECGWFDPIIVIGSGIRLTIWLLVGEGGGSEVLPYLYFFAAMDTLDGSRRNVWFVDCVKSPNTG